MTESKSVVAWGWEIRKLWSDKKAYTFIMVMVSWEYIQVKIQQIIHIIYMQLWYGKSYLTKVVRTRACERGRRKRETEREEDRDGEEKFLPHKRKTTDKYGKNDRITIL